MLKGLLDILSLIGLVILVSCASMDRFDSHDTEYFDTVKEYSDRTEFYQGFMNVFQMHGTLLNSKVLQGQAQKKADSFKWTDSQMAEEQAKNENSLKGETNVFISFFSPENKVNNLDSPSSIWRVFLDVNGKRYMGNAKTYVGFQNEAQLFYPYHSVFAKAYMVRFPVPMNDIQNSEISVTVTGTIGSDTLKFHALR